MWARELDQEGASECVMRCPEACRFGAKKFDNDQPAGLANRTSMRIREIGTGTVGADGSGWLAYGQQSAAQLQFSFAESIGEETELTDADHPGGQHVKQETPDELQRIQDHSLGTAVIGVVLALKGDAALFERPQAVIGNRDAVSVAGQILEHTFWAAKGRLDVDHPVDPTSFLT